MTVFGQMSFTRASLTLGRRCNPELERPGRKSAAGELPTRGCSRAQWLELGAAKRSYR